MEKQTNFNFIESIGPDLVLIAKRIEENLDNEVFNFGNEIGQLLEGAVYKILVKQNQQPSDYLTAKDKWNRIIAMYREDNNGKWVNNNVIDFYNSIMNLRNNESHYNEDNNYEYVLTFDEKVSYLKKLFIVLSFLHNEFVIPFEYGKYSEVNSSGFDDTIYYNENNYSRPLEMMKPEEGKYDIIDKTIELQKLSVAELINNKNIQFVIPTYQRKYVWNTKNVEELIEGIITVKEMDIPSEYFGSIAISANSEKKSESGKQKIRLIDGQQRITTSLIFAKAVYDLLNNYEKDMNGQDVVPDDLKELFNNNLAKDKVEINCKVEDEHKALSEILNIENSINDISKKYVRTNVAKNYKEIIRTLELKCKDITDKNKSIEKIISIWSYFTNNFKLAVISFNKNKDEEMRIFENLNSKGTELTIFELIKNSLFLKIANKDFNDHENEIVDLFKNKIDFSDNQNYQSKNNNVEKTTKDEREFLYNFLSYYNKDDNDISNNDKKLLSSFTKFVNEFFSGKKDISFEEYSTLVEYLSKYIKIYISVITKIYPKSEIDLDSIKNYLPIFNTKKALVPFLFYAIDLFGEKSFEYNNIKFENNNKKNIIDLFKEIEKWSISLNQQVQGKSLKSIILKLINYLEEVRENHYSNNIELFKNNIVTFTREWLAGKENNNFDSKIKNSFSTFTPSKEVFFNTLVNETFYKDDEAKILLGRVEQWLKDKTESVKIHYENLSLEHIYPQKSDKKSEWYEIVKEEYPNYPDDKIIEERDVRIGKIGNFLLLDSNMNSRIQNNPLSSKKEYYKSSTVAEKLTFLDRENKEVNLFDNDLKFGTKEIDERSKSLAYIIVNDIYKYD